MTIKNRITELRQVKAGDLLENPRNWRTHPEAQRSALTAVLDEVGIAGALVGYETEDGLRLIDGHLRKEQDPEQEWPVLVLDVDDLEADKLLVTMDPLAAMADANEQVLADLIDSIDTDSDGMQAMLDQLSESGGMFNVDEAGMPDLSSGDKAPFQQMTFTLHDSQADAVTNALREAKSAGPFVSENENSNGNALARIAEAYCG